MAAAPSDPPRPDPRGSHPEAVLASLATSLGVDPKAAVQRGLTLDDVHAFVAVRVAHLLQTNRAYLLHVLYRVDVAEADVRRAFETTPPGDLPRALAALLVERQLQKLQRRRSRES